jgi:hypothetical protein
MTPRKETPNRGRNMLALSAAKQGNTVMTPKLLLTTMNVESELDQTVDPVDKVANYLATIRDPPPSSSPDMFASTSSKHSSQKSPYLKSNRCSPSMSTYHEHVHGEN